MSLRRSQSSRPSPSADRSAIGRTSTDSVSALLWLPAVVALVLVGEGTGLRRLAPPSVVRGDLVPLSPQRSRRRGCRSAEQHSAPTCPAGPTLQYGQARRASGAIAVSRTDFDVCPRPPIRLIWGDPTSRARSSVARHATEPRRASPSLLGGVDDLAHTSLLVGVWGSLLSGAASLAEPRSGCVWRRVVNVERSAGVVGLRLDELAPGAPTFACEGQAGDAAFSAGRGSACG